MTGKNRWDMLSAAFENYAKYIGTKKDSIYDLSLVDLLYTRNFKGMNASITGHENEIKRKLPGYSDILKDISCRFENRTLRQLTKKELDQLIEKCYKFINLTENKYNKIAGFGPSYASALLCAHFQDLIPILDRRVLRGANVQHERYGNKQVKNLSACYPALIRAFHKELKSRPEITLRELDREWFLKGGEK